jgi:hypothetical protein
MLTDTGAQRKASCEVCGNAAERCFEVLLGGERHVFDSFECAIRGLLPNCPLCGSLILGTGVQVGSHLYCSHACASVSIPIEV